MNNQRTKRLPKIIIGQFSVGLVMIAIAFSVLFFAQGYRFNLKNFRVIRTGVIFLSSDVKGADVYLNGKLQEKKTPFALNLTPGYYNAEIKKDGYTSWSASFKIEPELVTEYKSIVLLKSDPRVSNLTDQRKINLLNSPIDYLAVVKNEDLLSVNGYEIWRDNKLITRFSGPISGVLWYSDLHHILYQQGSEIRIIEETGINDSLLVKLSNDNPVKFVVNNRGDELYFIENEQYKIAKIR